jgi:hypothetical protein
LIVTAYGDSSAFDSVRELIRNAPQVKTWRFYGLKPAKGFEFEIRLHVGTTLDASTFKFQPLKSAADQRNLGIRLLVSKAKVVSKKLVEALGLALSTGIGEEAVASIEHVDAVQLTPEAENALSIKDLGAYIAWHR